MATSTCVRFTCSMQIEIKVSLVSRASRFFFFFQKKKKKKPAGSQDGKKKKNRLACETKVSSACDLSGGRSADPGLSHVEAALGRLQTPAKQYRAET